MKLATLTFSICTLLIAMVSIQAGAAFAKQLFPVVGPIGATTLRLLLASLVMLGVWRPWRGKLTLKDVKAILFYGGALGFMNLLFYLAIDRIPLGIAVALEFSGPLAVSLFASKKLADVAWVILAVVGIALVLPLNSPVAALDLVGVFLALGAGICWAFYIIFGQKAGALMHSGRAASLGMIAATLVVLPFGLFTSGHAMLSVDILPTAFVVAILSSALPYSLEMFSLKSLPAKTFGILMSVEPALAALSGMMFLHERLTTLQWVAIGCIMAASLGTSLSLKRETKLEILGD